MLNHGRGYVDLGHTTQDGVETPAPDDDGPLAGSLLGTMDRDGLVYALVGDIDGRREPPVLVVNGKVIAGPGSNKPPNGAPSSGSTRNPAPRPGETQSSRRAVGES